MVKKKEQIPRYAKEVDRALFQKQNMKSMVNLCISQLSQGVSDVASISRAYPYSFLDHHNRGSVPQMFSVTVMRLPEPFTESAAINFISSYLRQGLRHTSSFTHIGIGMDIHSGSYVESIHDEFGTDERFLVLYGSTYAQPLMSLLYDVMYKEDLKEKQEKEAFNREVIYQNSLVQHSASFGMSTPSHSYGGFTDIREALQQRTFYTDTFLSDYLGQARRADEIERQAPIPGTSRDRRAARTGRNVPRQGHNQARQSGTLSGLLRNI